MWPSDGSGVEALQQKLLDNLQDMAREEGKELGAGWVVSVSKRKNGATKGTWDPYYHSPCGKRFRSKAEVGRHLGLGNLEIRKTPSKTPSKTPTKKKKPRAMQQASKSPKRMKIASVSKASPSRPPRACTICRETGHDARTCPLDPVRVAPGFWYAGTPAPAVPQGPPPRPLLLPDDEGVRRAGCARAFAYLASGRKAKGRFEKPVPLMSRTFGHKPAGKYLALQPDIDKRTSQRNARSTFRRVGDNRERLRLAYSKMHNLGVFCTVPIPKGKVVLEYVGEKVRASVAQARQRDYHSRGKDSDYLFRLDGHYVLDATRRGGLARFINHSCDPNCFTRTSGHGENKMIQILAKRDIPAGDEIAYDYKFDVEGDKDKIPCYCGAGAKCRKYMN